MREVLRVVEGSFEVLEIGRIPAGCAADAVTSDGHIVSFCPTGDGRQTFTWDGAPGPPFDGVSTLRNGDPAVFVSPDGAHIAYVGIRGESLFVGRDHNEDPPIAMFSMSVPPTFDGAGTHLAYGAALEEGAPTRLMLDGRPVGERIAPIRPAFSSDGTRLAYVEARGERPEDVQHRIVLDGEPGPWFVGMRNAANVMQFSPDGHRFAYFSADGEGHGRWTVDGRPHRLTNEVRTLANVLKRVAILEPPIPAAFSPDARRFVYFADVEEKGVAMIEDDVAGPRMKELGWPTFSAQGVLAYIGRTFDGRTQLLRDGTVLGSWERAETGPLVFSPDGAHLAVGLELKQGGLFSKKQVFTVCRDGSTYPGRPGKSDGAGPVFSSDGRHLAWSVHLDEHESQLIVDGEPQDPSIHPFGPLVYDAADRLVHFALTDAGETIVVDGRPGPAAVVVQLSPARRYWNHGELWEEEPPFRTSPDGRHVAWAGQFEDGAHPILDDEVGPAFKYVIDCRFENGRAVWWAQDGVTLYRLEVRL